MALNTTPSVQGGAFAHEAENATDLPAEYARLRKELERLLSQPVKDFQRIDELVDELERIQLAFKAQHGIKGNNPNE